jgi:hypothetical protein
LFCGIHHFRKPHGKRFRPIPGRRVAGAIHLGEGDSPGGAGLFGHTSVLQNIGISLKLWQFFIYEKNEENMTNHHP